MSPRDLVTQVNWTRLGVILGVLGAFWLLVTGAGGILDGRYVMRRDMAKRDSAAAVQSIRDSVFQADVRNDLTAIKARLP